MHDGSRDELPATATSLAPLRRARVSNLAEEQLRRQIARGVWGPGERLPSERRMSEELHVSRASIREAIRGLETLGIVDVRHGQGAFVRETTRVDQPFFASWQTSHGYAIGELLGFRLLIEPELASQAAVRADESINSELLALIDDMRSAAHQKDLTALVRIDTEFHESVTRGADNRLYRDLLGHIAHLLVDSRKISLSVPGRALQVVDAHEAIVSAIVKKDPESAWTAMHQHLERFSRDMHVQPLGWSGDHLSP